MRIVNFSSGLGNQIFQYLFAEYLRHIYPNEGIYGYYNKKFLNKHNGLEVQKVFDIELPRRSFLSDVSVLMCRSLNRVFKHLRVTDNSTTLNGIYYDGWWQDKKYFLSNITKLKFRSFEIDETNQRILQDINTSDSVFIHIRRGDYLAPQFVKQYGGICTLEYYKTAIRITLQKYPQAKFFVFSNDLDWVKENLEIPHAVYVSNNTGSDSFKDMFLMTHCKAGILANSSFSFWGAMLNKSTHMIYPGVWNNSHTPDIFPEDWIKL